MAINFRDKMNGVMNMGKKLYEETGSKIEEKVAMADKFLEESGTKHKIGVVTSKVSEQFDVISGQAILKEVQERLAKQDEYNNILATKLFEALDRIKFLEQKIGITK